MSKLKQRFTCRECGYQYEEKSWAAKCEVWCKEHISCNLEIIQHGTPPSEGNEEN